MKFQKIILFSLLAALTFTGCGKATSLLNEAGQETNLEENGVGVLDASGTGAKGDNTTQKAGNDANAEGAASGTDAKGDNTASGTGNSSNLSTGSINTGVLTSQGSGYEGTKGSGNYNYGEALQKSLLFYELQRSGDLPENTRCNWRGDSCLNDGSDNGLDLSGGWFDAGDNVKFNLPMSYTAAMLGWSVYEDEAAYEESGQLSYALSNIKWANDYFIKCHPEDEVYYYQVGSGSADHSWWGPAELVEQQMDRPSYKVTKDAPGSAVTGETAASLAICSILYQDRDLDYSKLCLEHAKSLYKFSEETKSDAGYTEANGFYNSWSGFYDELAWAGAWLYLATDDDTYLKKAEEYYPQAGQDYDWALCWDDVHIGAAMMLAEITGKESYGKIVEKHLDYWTTGTSEGERITYTPKGLAWLDNWGSLRYATTTAYVAAVYSGYDLCSPEKADTYWDFAVSQADYALGSTGFSYEIGFGDSYPVHPHHRTAQGSYCNNMNEPSVSRHTLYGALVGGPDAGDNYTDEVSNYNNNEVACDYNAGFTGLLAKLYRKYHGQTLKDFGAVETEHENEIYAEGAINVDGQDFIEIKALVYNQSGWPARAVSDLELRYFIDLSEVYAEGKTAAAIEVTTNYMQSGTAEGIKIWDEENHIYYLSVRFTDGSFYPGGQEHYKKEIQVRMRNPEGAWDNSNDPSFTGLTNGTLVPASGMALYENGELVYGTEPAAGENAGKSVGTQGENSGNGNSTQSGNGNQDGGNNAGNQSEGNGNTTASNAAANNSAGRGGSASSEMLNVTISYDGSDGSSIAGTMQIKNIGNESLTLKDLSLNYYFTKDKDAGLEFACYHAAITGANGSYTGLNGVKGSFSEGKDEEADTICEITFSDSQTLNQDDTLVVNFSIHHSDWSGFTLTNDYSRKAAENIVIKNGKSVIFGQKP